jgi:hypothetical protein
LVEKAELDRKERLMARIIVTADTALGTPRAKQPTRGHRQAGGRSVLMDEKVSSIHLCDEHAAEQLIERLAWAVNDAEDAERATKPAQLR